MTNANTKPFFGKMLSHKGSHERERGLRPIVIKRQERKDTQKSTQAKRNYETRKSKNEMNISKQKKNPFQNVNNHQQNFNHQQQQKKL